MTPVGLTSRWVAAGRALETESADHLDEAEVTSLFDRLRTVRQRWPYPIVPRSVNGMPRTHFVRARRPAHHESSALQTTMLP